jgi:hypothetical protein
LRPTQNLTDTPTGSSKKGWGYFRYPAPEPMKNFPSAAFKIPQRWHIFVTMKRTIRFSPETDRDLLRLDKVMHDGNVTATISELIRTECRRRFGADYDVDATSAVAATPEVAHTEVATPRVASPKKEKKPATSAVASPESQDAAPEVASCEHIEVVNPSPLSDPIEPPEEFLMPDSAFEAFEAVEHPVEVVPDPSNPVPSWKAKLEADRVRLAEEAKKPKPKEFTGITKQA